MPLIFIEIIKIPEGHAPEEIRREWVGVKLISELKGKFLLKNEDLGLPTGSPVRYEVSTEVAIAKLTLKSESAAKWFKKNWPYRHMYFNVYEVKELDIDDYLRH
ncbi:MAG: hypothetical protein AAB840_01600 [Patescibacteria group bacterium]